MQIDKVLEQYVGTCGRYQKLLVLLLSIAGFLSCIYTMEILFSAGKMEHWCEVPQPQEGLLSNLTEKEWRKIATPKKYEQGKWQHDSCSAYVGNISDTTVIDSIWNISTTTCDKFEYDTSVFKTTIVNEWNVVCSKSYLISMIKSFIMVAKGFGYIIGGIVSDRFGRKRALIVSILLGGISRVGIIFAPNLTLFIICNSLTVFAVVSMYLAAFTLSVELVGPRWRAVVGALTCETYAGGYILLAGIAYFFRERQTLHIALSMGLTVFVPVLWIIPESPRWLLVRGHKKQATKVLDVLGRRNGRKLPTDFEVECLEKEKEEKPAEQLVGHFSRNKRAIMVRVLALTPAWFTANMAYFGLTINIQSFAGSMYVNLAIVGALEFVAALFGQLLISSRLGRRWPTFALYLLSGSSLLLILAVPSDKAIAATALAVIGRTCCSAYFTTIYIWTAELFPSSLRSTAVSVASFVGKVGGMIAPFLAELGMVADWLPMVLLGGLSIFSGFLMLALPETRNRPLPQTLDDLSAKKSDAIVTM